MFELWHGLLAGMTQLLSTFYDWTGNYGLAILLLTVVIRVALIPLAIKQAKTMETSRAQAEKMRKIQPELKKLKEKYRDDRQKLYEESKKLQDEHGISPLAGFAGCLPQLLQLPILLAMYRVLSGCSKGLRPGAPCPPGKSLLVKGSGLAIAISAGSERFLGMVLTERPNAVMDADGLLSALPYYILVGLMGATMWYQQKQYSRVAPQDPQAQQMQRVMQIMPVMFTFFSLNFPAGLTLYWVASNVWTIGQQYILLKRFGPHAQKNLPKTASAKPAIQGPTSKNGAGSTSKDVTQTPTNGSTPKQAPKPKGSGARKGGKKKRR